MLTQDQHANPLAVGHPCFRMTAFQVLDFVSTMVAMGYMHCPDTGTVPKLYRRREWWAHQDLNLEPMDYESTALTN